MEDPRGNKVFKKATQTDKFGIASAEFGLADEVNLGYLPSTSADGLGRRAVQSRGDRAELSSATCCRNSKWRVDFAGARQSTATGPAIMSRERSAPITSSGKPVDRAEMTVKASGMDVTQFEVASVQGKTDSRRRLSLRPPAAQIFRRAAAEPGRGAGADRSHGEGFRRTCETRGEPITVSESPLLITAVPEGGTLVPNLENQVFILTSYPDGTPASRRRARPGCRKRASRTRPPTRAASP